MLSMMFVFLALLATILLCVYDCSKPRGFPPGPIWLPFIGCLPKFQSLRRKAGYLHLTFEKLAETYGPIVGVKLGHQKFVVVTSHKLVKKALLRDEFNGRPDGFFFRVRAFGERKGVLFTEGTSWSHVRRLATKHLRAFGFGQLSMQEELAREARALVQNLSDKCRDQKPVPMHGAFDVPVVNTIWTMLTGNRFSYDDPKTEKVLEIIHDAFRICDTLGGMVSQMPFLRFIVPELCGYNNLMACLASLYKLIGDEVEKCESEMRSESHEARHLIDAFILEMISAEEDPTKTPFDRKDLLVLCLDLFLAASKTTTDALAITFAFLGHHPEWVKTLQEDLDAVVGRDRDPILEDAPLMPRVEAFIAEVQRTQVLTPLGVPHCAKTNLSFEGYEIPNNTVILTNFHTAHNDPTVWDRPEEFMPQRFLDENGKFKKNPDLMQFGLGKRRCLGETLARSSLFLYFTYIVHHFDIKMSEEHGPPCLEGTDGFVISPKPYYLVLTPRFTRK